ncbi:egg-lysin-like isoform X2 [Haliotis rubra]|uniref:egg-lysin-like isoform X2 n=1 Tax=Haliotis rubra TaxID=36100 RepID=UPI001EE4F9C8|nr:egg-lysin-like isoform X2 [Haliotis rubra]
MKLLVLCVLAMMVTVAMSRRWNFVAHRHVSRQFEVALKVQIMAGFDKKLANWLARHGRNLSPIQKKTLYFVNRRYMQTHWQMYMQFINREINKLGRAPNVNDYSRVGAEIGRRIPLEVTYSFLVRRNLIPRWRQYMGNLLAKRVENIPIR